jgi:hypothetical protein
MQWLTYFEVIFLLDTGKYTHVVLQLANPSHGGSHG